MGKRLKASKYSISAAVPRAPNGRVSQALSTQAELNRITQRENAKIIAVVLNQPHRACFGEKAKHEWAGFALGRLALRHKLHERYVRAGQMYRQVRAEYNLAVGLPVPGHNEPGNGLDNIVSREKKNELRQNEQRARLASGLYGEVCALAISNLCWHEIDNPIEWDKASIMGLESLVTHFES